jgi:hypothetical protein
MSGRGLRCRFGSYNRVVELAGLVPNLSAPPGFTDEEKSVSWSLRFSVLDRDGFRCTYCGGLPGDGYILHVDHVIPRKSGGVTEKGNLRTACHVCNMGKGARTGV